MAKLLLVPNVTTIQFIENVLTFSNRYRELKPILIQSVFKINLGNFQNDFKFGLHAPFAGKSTNTTISFCKNNIGLNTTLETPKDSKQFSKSVWVFISKFMDDFVKSKVLVYSMGHQNFQKLALVGAKL